MPLGDSITAGGDPSRPTESPQAYRGPLYAALVAGGYEVDFIGSQNTAAIDGEDADHEGHGGYTIGPDEAKVFEGGEAANLTAHVDGWLAAAEPDVVLLMVGVNDMIPSETRPVDPADAATKLEDLVQRIRSQQPGATVFVASYPPISFLVDPALPSLDDFTALNESAARLGSGVDPQIVYVPVFETLENDWTDEDSLAPGDALHPSAQGARKIADVWYDTLTPLLDARG